MKHDNIHETPDVSYIHNEGVAHEASDVNVGAIAKFTIGLLGFTLLTLLLMWMFKGFLEKQAAARPEDKRPPMAMTEAERNKDKIGPRLQGAPGFAVEKPDGTRVDLELREPAAEYHVVRESWEQILKNGGPDPANPNLKILPIEEAKRRWLESEAAKPRPAASDTYDGMAAMPSSSSAGRLNEKRWQ
jgi:hypothetical protein